MAPARDALLLKLGAAKNDLRKPAQSINHASTTSNYEPPDEAPEDLQKLGGSLNHQSTIPCKEF
jgi:hypothetical protein